MLGFLNPSHRSPLRQYWPASRIWETAPRTFGTANESGPACTWSHDARQRGCVHFVKPTCRWWYRWSASHLMYPDVAILYFEICTGHPMHCTVYISKYCICYISIFIYINIIVLLSMAYLLYDTLILLLKIIIFFSFSLACQRGWNVKEAARGLWGDLGSRPEGPARIPSFYGNEGNKTWQQLRCFLHQFPSKSNGKTGQNVKVCTCSVFGVDFLGYTHRKFNMDTKNDGSGKPEGHTFHVTVHSHHL